jgi:hypothetical protein
MLLANFGAALAVAGGFFLLTAARADDDVPGGDIAGSEELRLHVILNPTTNAPPGATGRIELEAENEDGVVTATLKVETQGLDVATYTVSITTKSDGSSIVLGTFDVGASGTDGDAEHDDGEHDGGEMSDHHDGEMKGSHHGDGDGEPDVADEMDFGTETGIPLPEGFNPMDIATITIADADGNVVLAGNLTDAAAMKHGNFKAQVAVVGGAAAPDAHGTANIHVRTHRGVKHNRFKLIASGATANSALTLKINGVAVGTVNSNNRGKVKIRALPAGVELDAILSLELDNEAGEAEMSASF